MSPQAITNVRQQGNLFRSLLALLAGFFAVVILSLGTDIALHAVGFFPPWNQPSPSGPLALATIYRGLYGILGGYITARVAPNRPVEHAVTGGIIGTLIGAAGAIATWNHIPSMGPHWYPIAITLLALPCSWLGGKLRIKQVSR